MRPSKDLDYYYCYTKIKEYKYKKVTDVMKLL